MSSTAERTRFLRFTISDRAEHWAQILTFIPLAVTGLVQRYDGNAISRGIIDVLGGIESVRVIHRWFAAILMLAVVYHLGAIGYRRFVLGIPRAMTPERADFTAARQMIAYLGGRRDTRPEQGRYTFEEKLEYWSLVWGTALMIATGFLLWNPIASATFLPGSFIPAAKAAHGGEALLAVLAVIVWHMYHVHVRHFNKSMFTGYLTFEEMLHDHAKELAAPPSTARPSPEELRERRRRYLPLYTSGAVVLLAGIWLFVSFEHTTIETIQPIESPVVFAPIDAAAPDITTTTATTTTVTTTTTGVTPTSTTMPNASVAFGWADFAPALDASCGACHGANQQFGGLDLTSYAAALAGGDGGPGIVSGDPEASQIVIVQDAGGHPAQLDTGVLADLRAWIAAGAPEVAEGPAPGPPDTGAAAVLAWSEVAPILADRCGACHGAAQQFGGLRLADYEAAIAGAADGPVIIAGDAAGSPIVVVQMAGDHPGQLTQEELATVRAWIDAGASEG